MPLRKRWWVVTLLFSATVINYLNRQTLSVLAPELRDRFHMSNQDYSHVLFAFLLAYMLMQTVWGSLMDRLGTRIGLAIAISVWSAAAILHAAATSALSFGAFRFLLGAGEAGNWPGAVKTIAEWFPVRERGFANGLFNSGSTLGALIAPPLIVWVAQSAGWRSAFLLTGSLGFLWLLVWLTIVGRPKAAEPQEPPRSDIAWRDVLGRREAWALIGARAFSDPVWWFYVFWLPEYLRRVRQFTLSEIGLVAWIPFLTAGIGNIGGGWLSGYLIRRNWLVLRARKAVMGVSAVAMLAGIPAVYTANASLCLVWISVVTMAFSSFAVNAITLPTDLFPPTLVASVTGVSGTSAAFGGMCFTLLCGYLVDRFGYTPVFLIAGLMPLIAGLCIVRGIRHAA